eukprot:g2657.t1
MGLTKAQRKRKKNKERKARRKANEIKASTEKKEPKRNVEKVPKSTKQDATAHIKVVSEDFAFDLDNDLPEELKAALRAKFSNTVDEAKKGEEVSKIEQKRKERNKKDDGILEEEDDDTVIEATADAAKARAHRKALRLTVSELKQLVDTPEVVENHDVTAQDPKLLIFLKALKRSVPVPRHWNSVRKYLAGKRGDSATFKLPEYIANTGIGNLRDNELEIENQRSLAQTQREKMRPKMGRVAIDYQKLHDAFFKYQTKPDPLISYGDLYYEGKEYEMANSTKRLSSKPGKLSRELQKALGMIVTLVDTEGNQVRSKQNLIPPPWLHAMQRYGPPPSYPGLKIPGLNAPIPKGTFYGMNKGCWGRPPVDEQGVPLYGDCFGTHEANVAAHDTWNQDDELLYANDQDGNQEETVFGQIIEDDEDDEEEEEEEEEEDSGKEEGNMDSEKATKGNNNVQQDSDALMVGGTRDEMLDDFILRKGDEKKELDDQQNGGDGTKKVLYQTLESRSRKIGSTDIMGSDHTYDMSALRAAQQSGLMKVRQRANIYRPISFRNTRPLTLFSLYLFIYFLAPQEKAANIAGTGVNLTAEELAKIEKKGDAKLQQILQSKLESNSKDAQRKREIQEALNERATQQPARKKRRNFKLESSGEAHAVEETVLDTLDLAIANSHGSVKIWNNVLTTHAQFGSSLSSLMKATTNEGEEEVCVKRLFGLGSQERKYACGKLKPFAEPVVVLVPRGRCSFMEKALLVQEAGASGIVIMNSRGTSMLDVLLTPPEMRSVNITIPAVMIEYIEDANEKLTPYRVKNENNEINNKEHDQQTLLDAHSYFTLHRSQSENVLNSVARASVLSDSHSTKQSICDTLASIKLTCTKHVDIGCKASSNAKKAQTKTIPNPPVLKPEQKEIVLPSIRKLTKETNKESIRAGAIWISGKKSVMKGYEFILSHFGSGLAMESALAPMPVNILIPESYPFVACGALPSKMQTYLKANPRTLILVDRGECSFLDKAEYVANGNAMGMLIVNNQGQQLFQMDGPPQRKLALEESFRGKYFGMINEQTATILRKSISDDLDLGTEDDTTNSASDSDVLPKANIVNLELSASDLTLALWAQLSSFEKASDWPEVSSARRKLFLKLSMHHHPDKSTGGEQRFEYLLDMRKRADAHYKK